MPVIESESPHPHKLNLDPIWRRMDLFEVDLDEIGRKVGLKVIENDLNEVNGGPNEVEVGEIGRETDL